VPHSVSLVSESKNYIEGLLHLFCSEKGEDTNCHGRKTIENKKDVKNKTKA
jgi:hypothetical protein